MATSKIKEINSPEDWKKAEKTAGVNYKIIEMSGIGNKIDRIVIQENVCNPAATARIFSIKVLSDTLKLMKHAPGEILDPYYILGLLNAVS